MCIHTCWVAKDVILHYILHTDFLYHRDSALTPPYTADNCVLLPELDLINTQEKLCFSFLSFPFVKT